MILASLKCCPVAHASSNSCAGSNRKNRRREQERRAESRSAGLGMTAQTRDPEVRTDSLVGNPVVAQGPQHSAESFSGSRYTIKDTDVEFVFRDTHLVRDGGISSRASARFAKSVGEKHREGPVEPAAKAGIIVELMHQLCLVEEERQAVSAGRYSGRR